MTTQTPNRWRNLRDAVLFLSGLALAFHEAVWRETDRPVLLGLAGAMMGLAAFFRGNGRA